MVGCAIQRVSSQHKVAPGQREGSIESVHHAVEQRGADNAWILGIEINEQFDFDDALRKGSLAPGVCFLTALEKKASGPARRGNVFQSLRRLAGPSVQGYALATIFMSAPMALSRGVTAIWLPSMLNRLKAQVRLSIAARVRSVPRRSTRRQRFKDTLFEA